MALMNLDSLRYPGAAPTTGGTPASNGADTTAATSWAQQQPWYRQTLASWGNPQTLTLGQRGYLARTAIAAGMDPSFGIATDGRVEDWTTNNPMFWAGVAGMGGGLAASAVPSGASAAAGSGTAAGTTAAGTTAAGGTGMGLTGALTKIGTGVATDAASSAAQRALGGSSSPQGGGSKTAEAMALISGLLAGQLLKNHGAQSNVPPQLSQMLDLGTQRALAQQPTFNAVNQGTFAMLPEFAKQGVMPPSPMTFTPSTPPPGGSDSGGGMNPALLALLSGAGGMSVGGLLTGTNPYGAIVDGLKKLFGKGGPGGSGSPYQVVGPPDPNAYQVVGPPDPNDPAGADWSVS